MAEPRHRCDPRPNQRRCPEPDTIKICGLTLSRCLWTFLLNLGVILAMILLLLGVIFEIFHGLKDFYEPHENYAYYGIGARVEPMYQNAPTCLSKGCSQLLGFNIFCDETYSPSNILKVGKEGWCLESDNAKIMVSLSQPSQVQEIWISSGSNWHSPRNVYTDTIRKFKVTGYDGNMRSIFSKNLKMEPWGGLQKFNISQHTEGYWSFRVDYILLEIKSNYGASETFLNRFIVMAVKEVPKKCNGICRFESEIRDKIQQKKSKNYTNDLRI